MEDKIKDLEKKIDSLSIYTQNSINSIAQVLDKFNKNFERVNNHLTKIEKDIAIINTKIDNLDGSMTKGFSNVDIKIDDLSRQISKINNASNF